MDDISYLAHLCEPRKRKVPKKTFFDSVIGEKLLDAFMLIDNKLLMSSFLIDLLTTRELTRIARRLQIVEMLFALTPYEEITSCTGFSSATIARIGKLTINNKGGFCRIMRKMYPSKYRYFD